MDQTRRTLFSLLPALCAAAAVSGEEAAARTGTVIPSQAHRFEDLPVHGHGNLSRPVVDGVTHRQYPVEVHETTLQPGSMPHPAHHHRHEEMFLVREGTVEVTINGKSTRLDSGGAAYIASDAVHGIKNVGNSPANYFVIALGGDKA